MSRFMSELFEEFDPQDEDADATTELPRVAPPPINPDPTAPLFPPQGGEVPAPPVRGERERINTDEVLGTPVGKRPGRFQQPKEPQTALQPVVLVSAHDYTRRVTQIDASVPGIIVNAFAGPEGQTLLVFEHVTTKEEFEIKVSPPVLARLMQASVKAMGWYAKEFQTETDRH